MNKVIVISAHPDDETLGVGGTLLKHARKDDKITWLIATRIFESQGFTKDRIDSREAEIKRVSELFGFNKVYQLDYPTMTLTSSSLPDLVPEISDIFHLEKPEIIYCINRSDAHSDHRLLFEAVMACTKSFRYPFIKKVLLYECISETEFAPALHEKVFIPNYFVDISDHLDKKLEIMKVYGSELGQHPFPRSLDHIKALAIHRGAIAGVQYAEAFQLIKFIDK
ncbi:PIG-L family deacetylase [Cryomorphaceae bacterium 1068]|nr:PIG-L family deacetylase [Cryomorphaceae bacterium 1068]